MAIKITQPIKVIAFVGKMGSGKTTAAKYVEDRYAFDCVRLSFADGLKKMLEALYIPKDHLYGSRKNEPCTELCGITARHAMITLGTEWGRDMIHPDIWVNALARKMGIMVNELGVSRFVIDDVRFMNEASWVKGLNEIGVTGKLIRIIRETEEKKIDHRSETEMDNIVEDWLINNSGDLCSLYYSIDEVLLMMNKE